MKVGAISVIVPCYNAGRWVKKCLDSILAQTHAELDIVAVDDGSTDDTAEILASYTDRRVRVITQKNKGVSAARNIGIDCAEGEYIAFVDSDDWLEPNMYERLYRAAVNENSDMAVCNYNLIYEDHIESQYSEPRNETTDVSEDAYGYFMKFCACPKPNNYIWTRLYKTGTVEKSKVRFENYKLGDDTLFNFKLLPHIRRVTWIPDGFYNYRQQTESNIFTAANKSNLARVYADTFDALAEYYESENFVEFMRVLPIHAFTRLRSVFFYSRLAGIEDDVIIANAAAGFRGRKIAKYITGEAR